MQALLPRVHSRVHAGGALPFAIPAAAAFAIAAAAAFAIAAATFAITPNDHDKRAAALAAAALAGKHDDGRRRRAPPQPQSPCTCAQANAFLFAATPPRTPTAAL